MIKLNLTNESRWVDLGHGVRVKVKPLSTAVMMAARQAPEVIAASVAGADNMVAQLVAPVIGREVIEEWEGVGDEDGAVLPVSPEAITALFQVWPLFEAFQSKYVAGHMLLDAEKNGSALSPSGSSEGA